MSLQFYARPIVRGFHGRLPTLHEMREINNEFGVELATTIFHMAVQESEVHGEFARQVRQTDLKELALLREIAGQFEVTVVASQLFQSQRKWGDHVDEWRGWARAMGFTTDTIETDAKGSIPSNAGVIAEYLRRNPHPHRLLLTFGQGTSEFRYLLQRRLGSDPDGFARLPASKRRGHQRKPRDIEIGRIRAWINICGAFAGAGSSKFLHETWFRRTRAALTMWLAGRNPAVLEQTSPDSNLWKTLPEVPSQMLVASVIGVPQRSQIPLGLRSMYRRLARALPNDGAVNIYEAAALPGLIVPVPGLTQQAESVILEPVLKRLLVVTVQTMVKSLADEFSTRSSGQVSDPSSGHP